MKVCYSLINFILFKIELSLDELTIELPNNILEPMVDIHTRMLTAIPKNRRSYWSNKVDEFYLLYFQLLNKSTNTLK